MHQELGMLHEQEEKPKPPILTWTMPFIKNPKAGRQHLVIVIHAIVVCRWLAATSKPDSGLSGRSNDMSYNLTLPCRTLPDLSLHYQIGRAHV